MRAARTKVKLCTCVMFLTKSSLNGTHTHTTLNVISISGNRGHSSSFQVEHFDCVVVFIATVDPNQFRCFRFKGQFINFTISDVDFDRLKVV